MIKIMKYGQVPASEIFDRGTAADDVSGIVRDIIKDVSENGDTALKKYCAKFPDAEVRSRGTHRR